MKFPRNAKVFRGQLDVAPFAGIFFLLCLMLVFSSLMVYSPGVPISLPSLTGEKVPGILPPVVNVAVDAQGKIYFESQYVTQKEFEERLGKAIEQFQSPPTLIIQGDKQVELSHVLNICHVAGNLGIAKTHWATRTEPFPLPR